MKKFIFYSLLALLFFSCKGKEEANEMEALKTTTPVTITNISSEAMQENVVLNATSAYLQKWIVRANATGYLKSANVQLNKQVDKGQILYTIKTKEAESIGNSIKILDSTFHFSGVNSIHANGAGFISQLFHQNGDYVQDGEQLAEITDTKDFVFLLDMPYELRPYIVNKKSLELTLPDGEKLQGNISGNMPTMDATSQTQRVVLRITASHTFPENLIAKVSVAKTYSSHANSLPKTAVLTNETQEEFWVMKLINDSVAVKVPIEKGIESENRIEIKSPTFTADDRIIMTGNYGLDDTAHVQIVTEK